jgi:hypothetical protein
MKMVRMMINVPVSLKAKLDALQREFLHSTKKGR